MRISEITRRFPRTIAALMGVAGETNMIWAVGVVAAAKETHSAMSVGLVREAARKRHTSKVKAAIASRKANLSVGDVLDVPLIDNSNSLPKAG